MKKIVSLILCVCAVFSVLTAPVTPVSAAGTNDKTVENTIRMLGIMKGDENGNMQLDSQVTRAQFAVMLVSASSSAGSVGTGSKTSPFPDVRASHWAAEYVKIAVSQGWMSVYSDGYFKPDETVTLDIAAAALLTLLGYSSSDLNGSYPSAHISKFNALGLSDELSLAQGQILKRYDCMYIFYNLMSAATKQGASYGSTIGITVDSGGRLDYEKTLDSKLKGPFVHEETAKLQLSFTPETVYRDGKESKLTDISEYDAYYYNEELKSVWAYSTKAFGLLTGASPNRADPASVTVGSKSYSIANGTAAQKLSTSGGFKYGDLVILILDKNGAVIDAVPAVSSNIVYYGIVIDVSYSQVETDTGSIGYKYHIQVACTDGQTRTFTVDTKIVGTGSIVMAGYIDGKVTMKGLSSWKISGQVNSVRSTLGEYTLSPDIEILDITRDGTYTNIYASRLNGVTLNSYDIIYYTLDEQGRISRLILDNVTGDMYDYAIVTSVNEPTELNMNRDVTSSYEYIINGKTARATLTNSILKAKTGPSVILYKSGVISEIKALKSAQVSFISSDYVLSDNKKIFLSSKLQVYIYTDGTYYLAELSDVSDLSKYNLTAYCDDLTVSAGGVARIIYAMPKN